MYEQVKILVTGLYTIYVCGSFLPCLSPVNTLEKKGKDLIMHIILIMSKFGKSKFVSYQILIPAKAKFAKKRQIVKSI